MNPNIVYCKNIRGWGVVDTDSRKRKRILIIDDDRDIDNQFKIYLEHDGFQADTFTNPIDALYYFKKNEYDLILLDLKMPQIDGITMFQTLIKKMEM